MGALYTSLDTYAQLAIPGFVAGCFAIWQGRKTRRVNTEEHHTNADYSRQAAEAAERAARAAGTAARSSARVEGRLEQYIEDHAKVHASLPRH